MSAQPVDVLALLDRIAGREVASAEAWFAKDAVAELIHAAKRARTALKQFDHVPSCDGAARELDAALARIGGAV